MPSPLSEVLYETDSQSNSGSSVLADMRSLSNEEVHYPYPTSIDSKLENVASNPFYAKLISGAVSGVIGTSLIFPVDLVKTRLQNQQGNALYKNGISCAQHVLRVEGLRGLYRGLLPNLIGVTPEKAIKLAVNDTMRNYFSKNLSVNDSNLPLFYGMVSGAVAGFCQVIATNPMEIVKINMQVAGDIKEGSPLSLMTVVRRLGLRGLYYGVSATLIRDIPFSIIFFSSFSMFKNYFAQGNREDHTLELPYVFASGIMAGIVGAFTATPMDVAKTRFQVLRHGGSPVDSTLLLRDVYRNILKNEGVSAFFKGSLQRCCIIAPLFGVSLLAYEFQQRLMISKLASNHE